jgi:16S rRNA (guanine1207-N2)-methyltransferase
MSAYTPASEMLLRHRDEFVDRHVIFAGDIQDTLLLELETAGTRVHTQQFHHWQLLEKKLAERASYSLVAAAALLADCDTLVYYWPKNKPEAQFQLFNLLSLLPLDADIFVVGENRSGIRSVETMLADYCPLKKVDSARRCGFYHGNLKQQPKFNLDDFYDQYQLDKLAVTTLPGVFSRDGLDSGSALLLSTFQPHMKGKVLDLGCGAGVLAAALQQLSPKVRLWLVDAHAAAVAASQATLSNNQLQGEVFASNVFSEVTGRFDLIISNPPFHEGRETNLDAATRLIRGAAQHLNTGGELRIVANAFLPYPQLLQEVFGNYKVLAQTGRFRVYQSLHLRKKSN